MEAAPAQPHRHARRLPANRFDACAKQAAQGDWRLQAVDAGTLRAIPFWRNEATGLENTIWRNKGAPGSWRDQLVEVQPG